MTKKLLKPKKATVKPGFAVENKDGETVSGQMKLLMCANYKNGKIYVRRVMADFFLWDCIFNGEMYSSFFVIKPAEGKTELSADEVNEVTKMCYAGAAATIDYQRGDRIAESDQEIINKFEEARTQLEKAGN